MDLQIGDVVAVRNNSFVAMMIRLGSAFLDRPNLSNHIAVVHHVTENPNGTSTLWGIEGKPGGVGWIDMTGYINSKWTLSNADQPKTDAQRALVCSTMEGMLGTAYDWAAIASDLLEAMHIPALFGENWNGKGSPGHVVCSSVAAYAYNQSGLKYPKLDTERRCSPGDWDEFIITRAWE